MFGVAKSVNVGFFPSFRGNQLGDLRTINLRLDLLIVIPDRTARQRGQSAFSFLDVCRFPVGDRPLIRLPVSKEALKGRSACLRPLPVIEFALLSVGGFAPGGRSLIPVAHVLFGPGRPEQAPLVFAHLKAPHAGAPALVKKASLILHASALLGAPCVVPLAKAFRGPIVAVNPEEHPLTQRFFRGFLGQALRGQQLSGARFNGAHVLVNFGPLRQVRRRQRFALARFGLGDVPHVARAQVPSGAPSSRQKIPGLRWLLRKHAHLSFGPVFLHRPRIAQKLVANGFGTLCVCE